MLKDWKGYNKNLWGILSIVAGSFLVIEHIFSWGEFTLLDFIGHEWLGLLLILFGIGINVKKGELSQELFGKFKHNG